MKNIIYLLTFAFLFVIEHSFSQCHAGFTWDQIGGTYIVEFTNTSTSEHDIISYHWNFGDGSEGDGQNPDHNFEEPGTYNVCLIIMDSEGCAADVCHEVLVEAINSECNAEFEWEQGDNFVIHFINQSTSQFDIISYSWNFGDGHESDDQNPNHEYDAPGTYNVCLIIEDGQGCVSDVCHEVVVEAISSECDAEFVWEPVGGTFTIEFLSTSTSSHEIISYHWIFGDGHDGDGNDPSHTYDEPGTYNVCLIIENEAGCVADVCHEVVVQEINSECNAGFAWDQIGNTLEIEFINQSTSEHDIVSFHWDFGDGHEGDGEDPHHIYDEPGTYEVCLTIENELGCVDETCHAVIVEGTGDDCNAAFEWEPGDNNLVIHFINQSTSDHDIVSYHWNFGDGHEGDGQNPNHEYDEPGVYLVCLIITDGAGCVSDVCHEVVVEGNSGDCEAGFVWEAGGDNSLNIHFDDTSDDDPDIVSWHWTFGDGHSSDDQNPVHLYGEPGVYLVCLIVTNEFGCVADVCHEVHVENNNTECEAGFTWEQIGNNPSIQFHDTSDDDPDIVSWQWNFGDGHTSDDQHPGHEYDAPGVYVVCLIVTNEFGCVADVCHEVHVEDGSTECSASFVWEHGLGTTIHFVSTSDDDPDIISWQWNFGDGHTSDDENPVHHYDSAGVYLVCLIVTNEFGCVADVCQEVHVEFNVGECDADFVWDQIEGTYSIHFINTSDDDPDNVSWNWNFGDGHTSDDEHPTHEFDTSGVYLVCLIVTNEFGCVSDVCHEVHVFENTEGCQASFTWEQIDGHEAVHFNGTSESQNDIVSYHWNFGDGHEGDGQAPNHEYEPGVYIVCLTIEDSEGCVSDICQEVVVEGIEEECHAAFDWEYLEDGLTVRFHSLSTSEHDIISFQWTFGDGGTGDTWNPLHTYDAPGVYVVCLTITDGAGCVSTICQEVVVEGESGCQALFEFENNEDFYQFFNNSTGTTDNTTYLWEFGDGSSSTEENPEHHYEEDGTYVVCLFISDTTTDCESHICHELHYEAMFQEFEFQELKFYPPISATPTGFTSGDTEIFLKSYTNPVAEVLHLDYTVNGTGEIIISLYDVVGLQVKTISGEYIQRGRHESTLDVSDVYPGIYVLTLQFGDQVITRSVVITK